MSDIQTVELALSPKRFDLSCDRINYREDNAVFWSYDQTENIAIDVYYFYSDRIIEVNSVIHIVPERQTLGGYVARLVDKLLRIGEDD